MAGNKQAKNFVADGLFSCFSGRAADDDGFDNDEALGFKGLADYINDDNGSTM